MKRKSDSNMLNEEASGCGRKMVTKGVTKKKNKKQKVQKEIQAETIDVASFNIDQCRNPPTTTNSDIRNDEANVCNGASVSKAVNKKKRKKQKVQTTWEESTIDESSFTIDQRTNPPATVCDGDLPTKAVTKKKLKNQKVLKKREEEVIDGASFNIEQCRNPHEGEEHWELRRAFLEKNQHVLPPDELICLAQVYINVELLGCRYAAETMEMVTQLSEGLGRDYHRARALMLKRTFVSASDAAACKVRRLNPTEAAKHHTGVPVNANAPTSHCAVPSKLLNRLRSDLILLNNNMRETIETFNNLNDDLRIEAYTRANGKTMFKGFVTVGGFTIAQDTDLSDQGALKKALKNAGKFLSQHCYSIVRKSRARELAVADVVPKSEISQEFTEKEDEPEISKLDTDNIGFKLLAKLGWNGGCLGVRGDGIVDPVAADLKQDRKGLGLKTAVGSTELNRAMIKEKLMDFRDGKIEDHQLVFSSECSKEDRKLIHRLANKMNLRSQSYGLESQGTRRLVVSRRHNLRPTELLRKLLVERDPTLCQMYNVTIPTDST